MLEIWCHFWTSIKNLSKPQFFDYLVTEKYLDMQSWVTYISNILNDFTFNEKIISAAFNTYVGYFLSPFSSSCWNSGLIDIVVLYSCHLILLLEQMDNPEHLVPDQETPSNSSKDLNLTGGHTCFHLDFVQVELPQIVECIHSSFEKICISIKMCP